MRSRYGFAVAMLIGSALMFAQARNDAPDTVAGIAVNYDESKVGAYVLLNALTVNDGKPVRDAKTWWNARRPEILELFETRQYGRAPGVRQMKASTCLRPQPPSLMARQSATKCRSI